MEQGHQLSLPGLAAEAKPRDTSLAWLAVFTSAALTLASATHRTKASPPGPIPARSGAAGSAAPKCGPSCPLERQPSGSERRRLYLRAAAAAPASPSRRG